MNGIRADEISKIIRQQIEGFDTSVEVSEVGTIIKVGDGIAEIFGLERVMAGELLELPHEVAGIALNLEEDKVGAVLFGDYEKIKEGDQVFEDKGIKIVVDKKSFLYLIGTELDFSGGLNGKGFVFNNPNANRTCGCGESFAV